MRDPRSELTNFNSAVATEVVAGVLTCRGVTLLASLRPDSAIHYSQAVSNHGPQ